MPDKAERAPVLWTKSRGPIMARTHSLELAQAINGLLVSPIAVLPVSENDTVRPFQIGIGPQIRERLKDEADLHALNGAIRRYAYSQAYAFACAQPNAMRHDLDGKPVEPVSEKDRFAAMTRILANLERRKRQQADSGQDDRKKQAAP